MQTSWLKHEGRATHWCVPPVEGRETVRTGDRWVCVCGVTYRVGGLFRSATTGATVSFESFPAKDHGYVVTDLPRPSLEEL